MDWRNDRPIQGFEHRDKQNTNRKSAGLMARRSLLIGSPVSIFGQPKKNNSRYGFFPKAVLK